VNNNPVLQGLQAFMTVDNHFRQQRLDKRAEERQAIADRMAQETHAANMAEVQRKTDLNEMQSLAYAQKQAELKGEDIDFGSLRPKQQEFAKKLGLIRQRVNTDGSTSLLLDNDKLQDPQVLRKLSPIYADLDDAGAANVTNAFGVLSNKFAQYSTSKGVLRPGGVYITEQQDPELFEAANIALAPSINKNLDSKIAQKRLTGMALNPDGTLSFEVELVGHDGKSLGKAPITYDRANGNPNSAVLQVPTVSVREYIEANKKLGEVLAAERVRLGDDAPLKEQDESIKNAKAIKEVNAAIDKLPDGERKDALKAIAVPLQTPGVSPALGKIVSEEALPEKPDPAKHFTYEKDGYKITEGYVSDGKGGLKWGVKGKNRIKETGTSAAAKEQGALIKEIADQRKLLEDKHILDPSWYSSGYLDTVAEAQVMQRHGLGQVLYQKGANGDYHPNRMGVFVPTAILKVAPKPPSDIQGYNRWAAAVAGVAKKRGAGFDVPSISGLRIKKDLSTSEAVEARSGYKR
jgi:hypothetical protein